MGGRPDYVEQLFAKYAKEGQLKRKEYSAFVRGTEGEPEAAVDRHRWEHDCKALGRSPSDGLDLGAFRKLYEYSRGYTGPRLHIGRAQEDLRGVPPQHVRATITLDGEIDDLAGKPGSDVRKSFLLGFVQDVASVLSSVSNSPVSAAELTIMHIARPSAVVDLDIAPNSTDGVSVSPANVAAAFYDAVHLPTLRVSTKPGVKVERHDPHAQLKAIFARADRNHDGVLTRGELAARLREDAELAALLKLPDAESMSPGSSRLWARDFDRIFKQMDADESRRIDETEFIRYFSRDFFRAKLADQVADVAAPQLQARIALEPEPELSAQARGSELEPVEQSVTTTSQTGRRSKPHPPAPLPLLRWPSELSELVVVPQVAACLSEIGLGCLDDCAFLDHGACTELRVAVERIGPAVQRKKAASALSALLDRVAIFQRWDTDSNGALDYAEVDECVCCAFTRDMLEQQLYHKAGCDEDCGHQPVDPPLRAKVNSMDQAGDGFLRFSVFYEHCRAGRFFSGLLKATDTEKVSKETDTGAQSVGSRSLNASGARRRTVESATKSPTHSGWQTEMEQQQELRRREWAETLEEAKRRSQDFARSAALAAQALEPSSPTSKQHTETTLGMALAAVDLLQYEAAMYAQGYVALDDLCDASAQELETLEEVLCLRPPECRRLRKLIETRGMCAPRGTSPLRQAARPPSAKAAAVGRFLGIAARAERNAIVHQGLQAGEVAGGSSVKTQLYVDERLRLPTAASKNIMAGLSWRAMQDEHGQFYYVHKDPKIASTYEKPLDYVAVWQELPRSIDIPAGEADLAGTAQRWCDMMSGEVIIGKRPQQTQSQVHGEETVDDAMQNQEETTQSGTSTSLKPTMQHEASSLPAVELPAQRQRGGGAQGQGTDGDGESYPWVQHEDEASGQPWWRNDETGDETWVRPF